MIPYVGDLSRADALLLQRLAWRSKRILEFGAGASTQIFRAYGEGAVISVETEREWIEKTERNLERLGLSPVVFAPYYGFQPSGEYDLIFVDGLWPERLKFALLTWPALAIGGVMALHDTRRPKDVANVAAILERFSTEIDSVVMNQGESNTTVITKRATLPLEDYNALEGRTPEQLGIA